MYFQSESESEKQNTKFIAKLWFKIQNAKKMQSLIFFNLVAETMIKKMLEQDSHTVLEMVHVQNLTSKNIVWNNIIWVNQRRVNNAPKHSKTYNSISTIERMSTQKFAMMRTQHHFISRLAIIAVIFLHESKNKLDSII